MLMVRQICTVAVAMIAVGCGGTTTTTPSTPPAPTTLTLSGQVTDNATAAPISGVTVTIVDGPNINKTATTDASGNYSLSGLQQSGFTVNVVANDYLPQSKGVTLTSAQTLSFQLIHLFSLAGRVTDAISGGGIGGATVAIANGPNAGNTATTDGSGAYGFSGLQESAFTTTASAAGYVSSSQAITLASNQSVAFQLPRACVAPPSLAGGFFLGWTSLSGAVQFIWSGGVNGDVISYILEVGTRNGGTDVGIRDVGNVTSYTWTGLQTSVDLYHARLRARNACGVSGASNEANPRIN
jgi:hypothetical protein